MALIYLFHRIYVVQIWGIGDLYHRFRMECMIHLLLNRKCDNFLREGGIYWLKCHCVRGAGNRGSSDVESNPR